MIVRRRVEIIGKTGKEGPREQENKESVSWKRQAVRARRKVLDREILLVAGDDGNAALVLEEGSVVSDDRGVTEG